MTRKSTVAAEQFDISLGSSLTDGKKSPMFSNGDHSEIPRNAGDYHLLVDR